MKIIILGSNEFSIPTIEKLRQRGDEILGVICPPDKPNKRGKKIEYSFLKKFCLSENINIYQFNSIRNDGVEVLKTLKPDLMIIISYGQIISKDIIDIPKYKIINIHPSLLPKYRGPSPIISSIINGDYETGVTIMKINEKLDAGEILMQQAVKIEKEETGGELSKKLFEIGSELIIQVMDLIENGKVIEQLQNDADATYTKIIKKEDCFIDFNKSAEEIHNFIRALNPSPVAKFNLNNEIIKVYKSEVVLNNNIDVKAGDIISFNIKEGIIIKCGENAIKLLTIQAPGGKILDYKSFLNGRKN